MQGLTPLFEKGILVLAGATQNDEGSQAIGSLFVVNVGSRAEAKGFSDRDPLTQKLESPQMEKILKAAGIKQE